MTNGTGDGKGNSSVFEDLAKVQLSPEDVGIGAAREVLSRVTVRKPASTEFFRVHSSPDMQVTTGVFTDRAERETYYVVPELRGEMASDWRPMLLVTAITKQNSLLLWPLSLPDETGRRNDWATSARDACEHAKTHWVRLIPDMTARTYHIYEAMGRLPEPQWPDVTLPDLLNRGFKDRIIDSVDHPVIRKLRGLV
jgi:hypothetical protein